MKTLSHPVLAALALGAVHLSPDVAQAKSPSLEASTRAMSLRVYGKVVRNELATACFKRVYDAQHLAAHTKQNVTEMLLLIADIPTPDVEIAPTKMELGATFRNGERETDLGNFCMIDKSALLCRDGCEGGVEVTFPNATTARVKMPSLEIPSQATSPETTNNDPTPPRFGTDDRLFVLTRTKLTDCLPIANDPKVRAHIERTR